MKGQDEDTIVMLVFAGIIGIVLLLGFALTSHFSIPETGQHTGYITETGYSGLIWKTHYVKVVSSQFAYGDTENYWEYGIDEQNFSSNDLWSRLQIYQENKTLVTVTYECSLYKFDWESDAACQIKSVNG